MVPMTGTETTRSFRIKCLECESIAWGDPDSDVEWWKEFHRDHCPGAEFEVFRDE